MTRFETNPPDLEPLDSAVIARCTDEERKHIGRMAHLWEMSVSEYVRFAVLRYTQTVLQRSADRTWADIVIEESRHVTRSERAEAEAGA